MKNKLLIISVFICGAVVMVFELAGSRIMAPYFGSSIYVWTGIIGVILGSLSLGYWLGGRIADKGANAEVYSRMIFLSGVAIFWTILVKDSVPRFFQYSGLPLEMSSLLAAILLFVPASVLLGLISPYAVRLKLTSMDKSASTVGNLYAASTVGSIVGTFAAGYFLIPFLGTANILLLLVAILLALSLVFSKKFLALKLIIFVVITACVFSIVWAKDKNDRASGRVSIETEYNSINIFPSIHADTGKPILNLSFDPFARQSSMFTDSDELVWDYSKFYRLAKHFVPGLKSALMIGGGAYSYPKDYLKEYPDATMDVVEIDPGITAAAKQYFRLPDDSRLVTYYEDARVFLDKSKKKYDVIFDDAFTSALTVPFQLTTKEAVQLQYDMLNENGAVVANIGGSIDGLNGRFLRSEYATFKSVFPQVYIYPVTEPNNANRVQNIMLVALKADVTTALSSADPELQGYLAHMWDKPLPSDLPILTDDYAPVEYYMKTII